MVYITNSRWRPWCIVRSSIFTPTISPSTISIFHHHFSPTISPRKITSINPFHASIIQPKKITSINPFHAPFSLSFINSISMHHSSYHSSTPFFLSSFFSSKNFLIIHFSLSSHHHLNYAPRSLIEFRLVKNIDILISKNQYIKVFKQSQKHLLNNHY